MRVQPRSKFEPRVRFVFATRLSITEPGWEALKDLPDQPPEFMRVDCPADGLAGWLAHRLRSQAIEQDVNHVLRSRCRSLGV